MTDSEIELLARAHGLFRGHASPQSLSGLAGDVITGGNGWDGELADAYRSAALRRGSDLAESLRTDVEAARLLTSAVHGHRRAARDTAAVLAAARADDPRIDNAVAMHELMRRRVARLREQHRHVQTAHRRAQRNRRAVQALRYPLRHHRGAAYSRAQRAVRAALSRLGCPYVWGATGPDRFDCSGLVKWAYAQAGVSLHRTTYDQINEGMAVARAQVRPGDLVFPHSGHVQMAIGHDLVVEAPQPGANVRISRIGDYIAIRRP